MQGKRRCVSLGGIIQYIVDVLSQTCDGISWNTWENVLNKLEIGDLR